MITDNEDFVNIEKEMQWLSFDSDDSRDDIIDVEHIDDEDKSMDNELLCNLRNWFFRFKIRQ